jgi:hypothetical protein
MTETALVPRSIISAELALLAAIIAAAWYGRRRWNR